MKTKTFEQYVFRGEFTRKLTRARVFVQYRYHRFAIARMYTIVSFSFNVYYVYIRISARV